MSFNLALFDGGKIIGHALALFDAELPATDRGISIRPLNLTMPLNPSGQPREPQLYLSALA